ncbi:MAG TPA: SLC13 family permease [Planctomycetota bacterium]
MSAEQLLVLAILAATVAAFLAARWRHDMVAVGALLACVVAGLVPAEQAFLGFGHPAVITVACVLILSRGLQSSGAVDVLARHVLPAQAGPTVSIGALVALGTLLSALMNNVGALALLMPVAVQLAARLGLPPGKVLMPLAFGSILGGMTTLIGTPPNVIVSGFREAAGLGSFGMFDFTPVGLAVAGAGLVFLTAIGWRLVPAREQSGIAGFQSGHYLTEVRVPEGSKAAGLTLGEIEVALDEAGAQVVGLVRDEVRMTAPRSSRPVRAGDILIVESEARALPALLTRLGLELEEDKRAAAEGAPPAASGAEPEGARTPDDDHLMELVVLPASTLRGRTASDLLLRSHHGINLLAVSRQGRRRIERLRALALEPGDLLLLQGPREVLLEFASHYGCVPLARRDLRLPDRGRALQTSAILVVSIAVAALGLLPTAVALAAGVLVALALRAIPLRSVYEGVDWSVIVLLAAMIPVAGALESTGTGDRIASFLLAQVARGHAVVALAVVLGVTMVLTDVMNNAATAALMCPIALGTATALGLRADPFLMAVAIGSSCSFLTPIGHQNSTLILGPGGFRFGDYWRLGLPLELLVLAVALPMLLVAWPM